MQYNFKVVNDNMVCDKREMPLTGNVNTYRCVFDIECDIENLLWFCVFERDGKAYVQPILENECFIPHEVLVSEGKIKIGCYATNLKEDDFKRISTNWVFFNSLEGAYSDAATPEIPEPDVWETLVLKCVPVIGENGNWFTYDITQMAYVDTGVKASGKEGEPGYTPVKGVDYWTPTDKRSMVNDTVNAMPKAQNNSGEYGLVKLGSTAKGIELTGDNELILKQASLANIENNSSQLVVTKPNLFKFVVALSTHQQMDDKYSVKSISVPSSFSGRESELPASYTAVKGYVDAKIGDVENVLDSIIAMQESLIGGDAV